MKRVGSRLYDGASWLFYWVTSFTARLLAFTLVRWTVEGREHVPRSGPFIAAANHLSLTDPPVLGAATHRRVVFMAKREVLGLPILGFIFRLYGAFGIRRMGGDLSALRRSQSLLRSGTPVAMFPEGTRSRGAGLGRPFPGAAVVAMRADALIVPAAISGTEQAIGWRLLLLPFRRPRLTVRFGEPFRLPASERMTTEGARQGAEEIMRRIAMLLPQEYLGDYGRELLARDAMSAAAGPDDQS